MRFRRMVAGAAAVLALGAMSACGSSDSSGDDGGKTPDAAGQSSPEAGGGTSLSAGLPSAATMADIETFVAGRTTCTGMHLEPKNSEEESVGSEWGIKERGVCYNAKKMSIRLLSIDHMKTFQARAQQRGGGYLVGKDFAVYSSTVETRQDLKKSGLLHLFCRDTGGIPTGFEQAPAEVDGCVLTNYID
ncbi:hypothetical protein AB0L71_20570 [Streptomyces sp. NPDC052052]|uniref:hypothetical protein n=1 Tax=Streptomyces sp. NPDC052052 TaxID=3154756 RepID=UPI0034473056